MQVSNSYIVKKLSFKRFVSYSVALGISLFSIHTLGFTSDVQAKNHKSKSNIIRLHKRSGVAIGATVKRKSNFSNRRTIKHSGVRLNNRSLVKRQRQIERRNSRVQRENAQRRLRASVRRTQPNGRFIDRKEKDLILLEVLDQELLNYGSSSGTVLRSNACPTNHNCGYRIYQDGSGPRIITPGISNDDLPDYDGLNGPKVITLD